MLEGLAYQFVYNLERHWLFNIRLRRWLILVCVAVPVTMWLNVWEVSRPTAVSITLLAVGILAAMWWAGRQRYVRFVKHDQPTPPAAAALIVDKTSLCATGFFEVGGMRRYFVDTPAEYTTFETREHCLMTRVSRTRFLLLGNSRQEEAGWWYTFFQPSMIRSIDAGWLYFGLRPRPALRLEIAVPQEDRDEVLHLSFEDEATQAEVLADLLFDASPG